MATGVGWSDVAGTAVLTVVETAAGSSSGIASPSPASNEYGGGGASSLSSSDSADHCSNVCVIPEEGSCSTEDDDVDAAMARAGLAASGMTVEVLEVPGPVLLPAADDPDPDATTPALSSYFGLPAQ